MSGDYRLSVILYGQEFISLNDAITWAIEIAKGMLKLHDSDTVHKDLTNRNILFEIENDEAKAILINVGEVKQHGTPIYMAPESFLYNEYTKKTDVWNYGVVLWDIVTCLKEHAFKDIQDYLDYLSTESIFDFIVNKRQTLKIPEYCNDGLKKIILDCWKYDPEERPTFQEILLRLTKLTDDLNLVLTHVD